MVNAPTATRDPSTLHPDFRARMERVFARLRAKGHAPAYASAWRDPGTQSGLFASGASQVQFSFHMAVDAAGRPAALAADVIDSRYGWGTGGKVAQAARFFQDLGAAAKAEGMYWGGDWSRSNKTWALYGMGWDPAHVQFYPNSMLGQVRSLYERVKVAPLATAASAASLSARASLGLWLVGGIIGTTILILGVRRRSRRGILP